MVMEPLFAMLTHYVIEVWIFNGLAVANFFAGAEGRNDLVLGCVVVGLLEFEVQFIGVVEVVLETGYLHLPIQKIDRNEHLDVGLKQLVFGQLLLEYFVSVAEGVLVKVILDFD